MSPEVIYTAGKCLFVFAIVFEFGGSWLLRKILPKHIFTPAPEVQATAVAPEKTVARNDSVVDSSIANLEQVRKARPAAAQASAVSQFDGAASMEAAAGGSATLLHGDFDYSEFRPQVVEPSTTPSLVSSENESSEYSAMPMEAEQAPAVMGVIDPFEMEDNSFMDGTSLESRAVAYEHEQLGMA